LLSGAGDQAGGCSGLQGGDPRGGTGWYLHLGPYASLQLCLPGPSLHHTILGSTADSAVSQQTVAGRTDGRPDGETDRGGSDANVDSE
jgi:hypothetical protein